MSTDPLDRFTARLGEALVAEAHVLSADPAGRAARASETAVRPDRTAGTRRAAVHPGRTRRTARPRRVARVAVLALTVVLLALAVGAVIRGGATTAAPGIGPTLQAAARNVDGAPGPAGLPRGSFFYTRFKVYFRSDVDPEHEGRPVVYDQWVARDGSGILDADPGRRTRTRASARPFPIFQTQVSYRTLASLPTDPAALARALRPLAARSARIVPGTPEKVLVLLLARSLAGAPTPTPVRAALLRVLSDTPGIRFRRDVRDHAGRPGVLLSTTSDGIHLEVILDPANGAILESSRSLVRDEPGPDGLKAGLINRATFLRSAVTAKAGQRP